MTGNPLRWASARAALVAIALLLGWSHELESLTLASKAVQPDRVCVEQRTSFEGTPDPALVPGLHDVIVTNRSITSRPGMEPAPSEGTSARPWLHDSELQLQMSPSPPCGRDRLGGSRIFSRKDRKDRKDLFPALPSSVAEPFIKKEIRVAAGQREHNIFARFAVFA
jgi:hypothetical protein